MRCKVQFTQASMAELVDASDLKSDDLKSRVGSIPSRGTLGSMQQKDKLPVQETQSKIGDALVMLICAYSTMASIAVLVKPEILDYLYRFIQDKATLEKVFSYFSKLGIDRNDGTIILLVLSASGLAYTAMKAIITLNDEMKRINLDL